MFLTCEKSIYFGHKILNLIVKNKINFFLSDQCLCEISRVLKSKKAKFLSLTFAQPHFRMPFYSKTKYKWNVDHEIFGSGFHYHCYSMTKGLALDDQVTIQSATDVSKVSLNINENYRYINDGDF